MEYHLLTQVVAELSQGLTGSRVVRVFEGIDRNLYFLLRKNQRNFILLLSLQRSLPRIHMVSRKPPSATDPHPLVLNFRSRLVGSHLMKISILNQDRIVEMLFEKGKDCYRLMLELTGLSSNLFFTDGELKIFASYYPVTISSQASRILLPGSLYAPPPKKNQDVPPTSGFVIDASETPSEFAENYYLHIVLQQKSEAIRSELRYFIRKIAKKNERKRAALTAELQAMEHAEEYRQKGDLILAHLQQLKQGIELADLVGYDGISVSVHLDPKRSPVQNAEIYFKKYKKAKKGLPLLRRRLAETEEEHGRLQLTLNEVENAADLDYLNYLHSTLVVNSPDAKGMRARQHAPSGFAPGIRSILYCGWEILVGRSATGNDYLTMKLAHDDDLWLHAEGMPGSHVVVRNPRKAEIPLDILAKAASLAAFYSKGKGSDKVPVVYTEARFVRKPKGAKPGLVMLSKRKTIMAKPADKGIIT